MIAVLKVFAKKAALAFAVICLVVFAFRRPEMVGDLAGKTFDGAVGAVDAVVKMLEGIASE